MAAAENLSESTPSGGSRAAGPVRPAGRFSGRSRSSSLADLPARPVSRLPRSSPIFARSAPTTGCACRRCATSSAGQSWFDTHQYRYLPPDGTRDALVAARRRAARRGLADCSRRSSARSLPSGSCSPPGRSSSSPSIAGSPSLALRRSFGVRAALLAIVVAPNLLAFRDLFGAGEIDHHNVQVVLTLASVARASRSPRRGRSAAILGGAASALSLAVGLETPPLRRAVGLAYAVAFVIDPRQARASASSPTHSRSARSRRSRRRPRRRYGSTPTCDTLSAAMAAPASGGVVARGTARPRAACAHAMAGRLALPGGRRSGARRRFRVRLPACLAGPYGAVPDRSARLAGADRRSVLLRRAPLALPGARRDRLRPDARRRHRGMDRRASGARGEGRRLLFVVGRPSHAHLPPLAVQIRAIYVGCALIPIAAGFALDRVIAHCDGARRERAARARALPCRRPPLRAALGFRGGVRRSATSSRRRPCTIREDARVPGRVAGAPAICRTGTILGPLDLGAHILFLTDHSIVAAGYHRNVEGIVAGIEAFAGSEDDMRRFARLDRADYVALCLPWIAAYPDATALRQCARGRRSPSHG